jgi:ZIP family zinc transporter
MNDYLIVLALTALPAFSNFAGGFLAEKIDVSQRSLSLALHAAAGIVLAVVAVELLPEGFDGAPAWLIILAFVAGGVFFVLVDQGIGLLQARMGRGEGSAGPWGIFFGVTVDLFSDGVMIGAGSTISLGLGLLLALGQAPADMPEGFATIASFKREGIARRTRQLLAASFFLAIFLGATVGYWAVRGQPEEVKLALLAFTAGILMTVVVEEIVPEAHEGEEARIATLVLIGGFALFALLAHYLG